MSRLLEWSRTGTAAACARPTGAYANCLAASATCGAFLRDAGIECGLMHLTGSRREFGSGAGRWPYYDHARLQHWTVRAGDWSIDWTARQFEHRAAWPVVERVETLAQFWRHVEEWACPRCPRLVSDDRHLALAPATLHRRHRALARASGGLGPFPDPRHDGTTALVRLCACEPVSRA